MPVLPEYSHLESSEEVPLNHPPRVTLLARTLSTLPPEEFTQQDWQALNASTTLAGTSARTCYSRRLVTPLDYLIGSPRQRQVTDDVVESTREAGHLSTRQHVYYVFALEGVSRLTVHSVLHSHPFHNSDQVSQRYTPMDESGLVLPQLVSAEANSLYQETAENLVTAYYHLTELLIPVARDLYLKRFPSRRAASWQKKVDLEATKKAQEVGRYLLPLAMGANLYHSVSALTLLRYWQLANTYPIQPESAFVIRSMVAAVAAVDPAFLGELDNSSPSVSDFPEATPDALYEGADSVDTLLAGQPARLDALDPFLGRRLAEAVRLTLGLSPSRLSDEAAVKLVLDPQTNPFLASPRGEMTMQQLSQVLNQVSLSALVSLSHSADSQLQRHRGFFHTQPLSLPIPRLDQDIVIPLLLRYSQPALDFYRQQQAANIDAMEKLAHLGVGLGELAYLQTNATRLRKRINGSLGNFYHWIKIRTCLSAQEEIYGLAVAIARELSADPLLTPHFDKPSPCGVRLKASLKPVCSEGDHYCGVPLWKKTVQDYPQRDI